MSMLMVSLQQGANGPYKNILSDPDIANLAKELVKINKL
jgi:hypothetical protein